MPMRPIGSGLALLALCLAAFAGEARAWETPFTLRGYVEGSFYPPRNEFDPNPGMPFPERPVARYSLTAYAEADLPALPRAFVFVHPRLYFGDSRPQLDYNYRADPRVANLSFGLGWRLTDRLDVRLAHGRMVDLGGYTRSDRLYWNAIQLRWRFGD